MSATSPPSFKEAEQRAREGGKYRLMLVDDEDGLRRAVSEYLEQASPHS